MAAEDVNTYAGRLATFERPHHFAKRRASSAKKKLQSSVAWPHELPAPEDFARAGFYYKPTTASDDSVTCFLCNKVLDDWDKSDDPFNEHLSHVPDCGWAINVCIEQRSQDMDRAEEDPSSENMIESRRATFKDAWPHEGRKGWKCKVQKMVEAGWCYAPLPEADDCVHCFYCGVSLDGWEPKDDPWEEHRKRAPECHFFTLIEEANKAGKKTTKGRARAASRSSKASRVSTQSNMTVSHEAPSMLEGSHDPAEEDDTIITTTSKAGKAAKKPIRKAKAAITRSTKAKETVTFDASILADDQAMDDALMMGLKSPETVEPMPVPAKTRSKRAPKKAVEEAEESVIEVAPPVRKVSRTKKTRKQTEADEEAAAAAEDIPMEQPAIAKERATRGKKRTSDGLEKMETSLIIDSLPLPPKVRSVAAKKIQPVSKQPVDAPEEPEEPEFEPITVDSPAPVEEAIAQPKKTAPKKGKAGRVVSRQQVSDAREAEASVVVVIPPLIEGHSPKVSTTQKAPTPRRTSKREPVESPPSPQTSDAENVPPSSRPSMGTVEEIIRIPLAATPRASPSKRNIIAGGLSTTQPWSAVDLETIFLPSPRARKDDQENVSLEHVFKRLSSPEKKMSVEEWILWNAQGAEQKMRSECERLIGIFEGEGNRAVRSLEGIQAS